MIRPKGFTVLIKPKKVEDEFKTSFGLVIPDTAKDMHRVAIYEGTVVDIAPNAFKDLGDGTPWCKVGDYVIYAQYGGKFVKDGEEELTLIQDKDILAVVE